MANEPQPADGVTTAAAAARPTGVTTAPPPAVPPADAAEPYRPMSGLAMAGFALAALFAVAVLIGGVIALLVRSPRAVGALLVLAPVGGAAAAALGRRPAGQMGRWAALALLGLLTVLGLGGLIASAAWGNPWGLPAAFWLLPLAALLVCWMALSAIARSEGTLDGEALARWGVRLSLFFALIYGAYSVANIFAVRDQAKAAAEDFLRQIAAGGDLYRAYVRSKPEGSRPADSNLREMIESENRTSPQGSAGPFSRFKESDYVQLIALGGDKNVFERLTVGWPELKTGSYHVEQVFRVTNPLATFEVEVTTRSVDRPTPEGPTRRTWYIDLPSCKLRVAVDSQGQPRPAVTLTAEGQKLEAQFRAAHEVAMRWVDRTGSGPRGLAFLETVPPAERPAMTEAWVVDAAWNNAVRALAFSPWLMLPPPERFLEARAAYERGAILDKDDLWAVDNARARTLQAADRLCRVQPMTPPFTLNVAPTRFPLNYRTEGGKALLGVTLRGVVGPQVFTDQQVAMRESPAIEAELIIEAPADATDSAAMYVKRIRLLRGQQAIDGPPGG